MKSVFIFLVIFVFFSTQSTSAQDDNQDKIKGFEIGGQITALHFTDFDVVDEFYRRESFRTGELKKQTDYGFGGRFTYNFNRNVAIEVEANYFPVDKHLRLINQVINGSTLPVVHGFSYPGGRKFQMVAGPKIGYRQKRFGVFGKVRPGFVTISDFGIIVGSGPPIQLPNGGTFTPLVATQDRASFFAVDVGGVAEFYPSKRTVIRFDIGDTVIRYNAQEPILNPTFTRHNLQISTGFGFRF